MNINIYILNLSKLFYEYKYLKAILILFYYRLYHNIPSNDNGSITARERTRYVKTY